MTYIAPCYGQFHLFDSTNLNDHTEARAHCGGCQIRDACHNQRPPWADGTWAGELYKDGDRVEVSSDKSPTPPVDNRVGETPEPVDNFHMTTSTKGIR